MIDFSPSCIKDSHSDRKSRASDDELLRVNHLPIARVKKIMKESEHQGVSFIFLKHIQMISSEAPVILAKACELLVRDLTIQSWNCTRSTKRCTLQRQDITSAIFMSNIYNFLYDLLTPEDLEPLMETPKMSLYSPVNLNNSILSQQLAFNKASQTLCQPTFKKNIFQNNLPNQPIDWTRFYKYSQNTLPINNNPETFQNTEDIINNTVNIKKPIQTQIKEQNLNLYPLPYYGMSPNQFFVDQRLYPSELHNQMRFNIKDESFEDFDFCDRT